MSEAATEYRSIMLGTETVEIDTLRPYFMNARRGDRDRIQKSLKKTGQYKRLTVNQGTKTGRAREILAGNNTWYSAIDLGWSKIDVEWVDVDDAEANRINIVDNRLNDLATNDTDIVVEQLGMFDDPEDIEASGWTQDEVDQLLTPPEPDDEDPDADSQMGDLEFRIVVDCRSESHQSELLATFEREGLNARPLVS